jgi:hypothetical protein
MNVIYRVNKGFKAFLCYFYQVLMGNIIFSTQLVLLMCQPLATNHIEFSYGVGDFTSIETPCCFLLVEKTF